MTEDRFRHPTPEELARYFAGKLDPAEEETTELHLAECDDCAEAASNCYALEGARAAWISPNHAAALLQAALRRRAHSRRRS